MRPKVLYCFSELAGKSFRPANGSEGDIFEEAFCWQCEMERGEPYNCSIHMDAFLYYKDEEMYPKEWIFDDEGWPICTEFKKAKANAQKSKAS